MAMIFGDYVGGFLGLSRDGIGWSMNPFDVSGFLEQNRFSTHAHHLSILSRSRQAMEGS
jgi:hypothetical protein